MFKLMSRNIIYRSSIALTLALFPPVLGVEDQQVKVHSLVPAQDQVSAFDAHWALARIYSHHKKDWDLALREYEWLHMQDPKKVDVILELAYLRLNRKEINESITLLTKALADNPGHPKILIALAQAETNGGHAVRANALFLEAVPLSEETETALVYYADAMMMWGDFFRAEQIYRAASQKHPESLDLKLKLAWALASAQRYEEAEGIYRAALLVDSNQGKILVGLVNVKILEKDFDAAYALSLELIQLDPIAENYILQGDILFKRYCYNEAIQVYANAIQDEEVGYRAYLGMARAYQELCDNAQAETAFALAVENKSDDVSVQFYKAYFEGNLEDYICQLIEAGIYIDDLEQCASLCLELGEPESALWIYQTILEIDPEYFPAQMGEAEMLSILNCYDASLSLYGQLDDDLPCNYKIMLSISRVLGWSKHYCCSIQHFDEMIAIDPANPVLYREKARTALWGKKFRLGIGTYDALLDESVDSLLLESLSHDVSYDQECSFSLALAALRNHVHCCSTYEGYEEFRDWYYENYCASDEEQNEIVEKILIDYLPLYRIQKSISLEKCAKITTWKKKYIHSLWADQEVIDFNPGNEEILFDQAQSYCILGLCDCSRGVYENILHISPSHNIVKMAMQRSERKLNFAINNHFSYWRELGSGTFSQSQIARYRFDTVFEQPISCRTRFRFIQSEYVENPFYNFKFYAAEGQSIEADHIFNERVSLAVSATYKNYFKQFKPTYTSRNRLCLNFNDKFQMVLGCDRVDEIYNFFSLEQRTQSILSSVTINSNLNRYWTLGGIYEYYCYNDSNNQNHINLNTSYQLSEDPNVCKVILQGDYRNTAHDSVLIFDGPTLVDVIHPYWTPQKYFAGSITLEYRHYYREFDFCEAPDRYIDFKVNGMTDSENNPGIQGIIEWKHDFTTRGGFELKGFIHRSRQWNAEGAWASLFYRF